MNITIIVLVICVLFCLFIFFYFKWYIKRRTSASEFLAEYQTEVHRLIAEIDSATDRDSMLVEDRINKLKTILEETDKRVTVYARELDRSRTGEALYTSLGRGIRAALNTPVDAQAASSRRIESDSISLPTKGRHAQAAQPTQTQPVILTPPAQDPSVTQKEVASAESLQAEPSPSSKLRYKIESMVNNGLSPGEIASNLKISIAEVDLAINLIKRR